LLEKQYIAGQLLSLLLAQKRFAMQERAPQDCQLQLKTANCKGEHQKAAAHVCMPSLIVPKPG
jgi:hypothetical protein